MTPRGSAVSWFAALVRNLFGGGRCDAELRADIESYVEMLVDERIAGGLTPEAARRSALMEVGSVDNVKDSTRSIEHRWRGVSLDGCLDACFVCACTTGDWH